MTDLVLLVDKIEERAAIIEEGAKVSREKAENMAARMHGFRDWNDFKGKTDGRNK